MTIHDLIKLAIKKLPLGNNTSPALDGEVLLSYVLKKPKEYLATHPKQQVAGKPEKQYLKLLNRRILGWPVAYLVKHKEFFGLDFYVDKNVLIPRPETEGLAELVVQKIKDLSLKIKDKRPLKILDLGTGSGCIIISIAKKVGTMDYNFFASDISAKALVVARKNAKKHKVKVQFKIGNLLDPWKNKNLDIIVANLPYLHRETDPSTKFEPIGALVAAKKGIGLYEQLLKNISGISKKPKYIFLEIGRDQGSIIKKLAYKFLPAFKTQIYKDLWGKNRYAIISSPL